MVFVIVVAVVLVALVAVALARRNRSPHTSVDSFRRQIDALGPAARRNVVDQVQTVAGRDADDESPDDDPGARPDGDADEDGARGS